MRKVVALTHIECEGPGYWGKNLAGLPEGAAHRMIRQAWDIAAETEALSRRLWESFSAIAGLG